MHRPFTDGGMNRYLIEKRARDRAAEAKAAAEREAAERATPGPGWAWETGIGTIGIDTLFGGLGDDLLTPLPRAGDIRIVYAMPGGDFIEQPPADEPPKGWLSCHAVYRSDRPAMPREELDALIDDALRDEAGEGDLRKQARDIIDGMGADMLSPETLAGVHAVVDMAARHPGARIESISVSRPKHNHTYQQVALVMDCGFRQETWAIDNHGYRLVGVRTSLGGA